MTMQTDVAIIGAGPNGLSIAAHLRSRKIDHVIAGHPMATWLEHMPKGMELKSEGFASTLYDPERSLTLKNYCAAQGWDYADLDRPVPLAEFCDYGLAFQKQFAPAVIRKTLVGLNRIADGFALRFDSGEEIAASKVILAVGITHFRALPAELADFPNPRVTHSADHHDLERFRGVDVVVLGGGSSAIDLAALLNEAGAHVTLAARRDELVIHHRMKLPRRLIDRVLAPMSGVGPASWGTWICTEVPQAFHWLGAEKRIDIVRSKWGPAAGWFMRGRVVGRLPVLLRHELLYADSIQDGVRLHFRDLNHDGAERVVETQHVIAATGYRAETARLKFLSGDILNSLKTYCDMPVLSRHFESSIPGLYFVGPIAMASFGPAMRFAYGARFAAPVVSSHAAATLTRRRTTSTVGLGLAPSEG